MTRSQRDRIQLALGIVIVVGFFVVLAMMIARDMPGKDILIGTLSAGFGAVVGYYFGSSSGSRDKSELLAQSPAILAPPDKPANFGITQ